MKKTSGDDRNPAKPFQILKDDAVRVPHSICQQIWKTKQQPQDWKRAVHSNPKERQSQRMFKLLYNCDHFTWQQGNAKNPSSQVSTVHELRTPRCTTWIQKRHRNQKSNCQHLLDHRRSKGIQKNPYFCFIHYAKAFDCMEDNKLWEILKEMGIPDITCLLRNLYAGQEATETDMEQWTGSKWGKKYIKAIYCHPA